LTAIRVRAFQPIFNSDLEMHLEPGPSTILGGNGLGKTTLMQAIVYGLTGGTEAIDEDKRYRWGHGYFRSRLSPTAGKTAAVEVAFRLGREQITVRRGLSGSGVVAVRATSHGTRWVENGEAGVVYEELLRSHGGYESSDDFSFIVNRLLYLPESRRLLAWDTDAQTRVLMLLNRDAAIEREFRDKRGRLKLIDTRKRHTHVQLGHAESNLSTLEEAEPEEVSENDEPTSQPAQDLRRLKDLLPKQAELTRARTAASANLRELAHTIGRLSEEVESIQDELERTEASVVSSLLEAAERENNLALHKLLSNGICPSCGTRQVEFQASARQHHREQKCLLCGAGRPQATNAKLTALRSSLADKMSALQANEQAYLVLEDRLGLVRKQEADLQTEVNAIRFRQPVLNIPDESLSPSRRADLLRIKRKLEQDETEYALQMHELQDDLEQTYKQFLEAIDERLQRLRASYEQYASEFLGMDCQLAATERSDRLLGLTAFVPEFGGSVRPTPDSCSEAQRFFLDIAFRMAILDLALGLSGMPGSFICETPENALDISYVDNVVRMFERFSRGHHSLLFTANVQQAGIAEKILRSTPRHGRSERVLNLLDYGQLTAVHQRDLRRLKQFARKVGR
jgi:DNA repair exonuclease SbcCD ATPase subunit